MEMFRRANTLDKSTGTGRYRRKYGLELFRSCRVAGSVGLVSENKSRDLLCSSLFGAELGDLSDVVDGHHGQLLVKLELGVGELGQVDHH